MSKKIWRISLNPPYGEDDAAVVPDAACFPVKEARALCKEMERMTEYGEIDRKQWRALAKYLSAVERMKARK